MTGTGVRVRVMVGVGVAEGVKVIVGVGVEVSGSGTAGSVTVGVMVGGVTGEEGLKIVKNKIAKKTIIAPIEKKEFRVITGGNLLVSLFSPEAGISASGGLPIATNKLLSPVS